MFAAISAGTRYMIPMKQLAKMPMNGRPISGYACSMGRAEAAARKENRSGYMRTLAAVATYGLALTCCAIVGLNE